MPDHPSTLSGIGEFDGLAPAGLPPSDEGALS
jgi:hypothetical protein